MARFFTTAIALAAFLALSAAAWAQSAQPTPAPRAVADERPQASDEVPEDPPIGRIFQEIGGDLLHMVSWRSVPWIGGGGLAAAAAHALDDNLSSAPGNEWAKWSEIFDPGAEIGNGFVLFGAAATTYAVGKAGGRPRVTHLGRDLLRAQAVAQLLVHGLKTGITRDRPDVSADNSFPSGHAAATFASAVVLQRHLGRKWALATYGVATYVAISRMHENKHYLSDVLFGTGLGIASGLSTTRHVTSSWALAPVVVPGGVAVTLSRIR